MKAKQSLPLIENHNYGKELPMMQGHFLLGILRLKRNLRVTLELNYLQYIGKEKRVQ